MTKPKWEVQSEDSESKTLVRIGHDERTNQDITEIKVVDKSCGDGPHFGFNDAGDTVFELGYRDER